MSIGKRRKPDADEDTPTHGRADPPYQGAFHLGIPREIGRRELRCLHTDASRPPFAPDIFEFHWRCPAWFVHPESPYCPAHRELYTREQETHTATIEERQAILRGLTPKARDFLRSALGPAHIIFQDLSVVDPNNLRDPWSGKLPAPDDKEDQARIDAADAVRHEQLTHAKAQGLLR